MAERCICCDEEFIEFWSVYPRHVGKKAARIAYARARRSADKKTIMIGVRRYANECVGVEPRYIAHAATWLNGERWEDEPAPASPATAMPDYTKAGDEALWHQRLRAYAESKFWLPQWGERPESPACEAPIAALAEFGFRNMH